jgi:predicted RecB family endonuclease
MALSLQRINTEQLKKTIFDMEYYSEKLEEKLKQAMDEQKNLGKPTIFNSRRHEKLNKSISELISKIQQLDNEIQLLKSRLPKKSPSPKNPTSPKSTRKSKKGLVETYLSMFEGGKKTKKSNRRTQRKA